MPLQTVEEALKNLEGAPARGGQSVDLQVRVSNFEAAVQTENARMMAQASHDAARTVADASDALRKSVEQFTKASNRGSDELATWSKSTATWTKWLTFATAAPFLSSVIQVIIMWLARR